MGRSSALLVASFLTFGAATAAHPAMLVWKGTLKMEIGTMPPILSTGSGVATVNGSSGLGHLTTLRLAAGITHTQTFLPTDPNLPTVSAYTLFVDVHGGTGTLAPISGGGPLTQNTLPIVGNAKICMLLVGCAARYDVPLTENGSKGFGIGGIVTVNGFGAGLRVSIHGAPWTVATATITGLFTTNAMIPPDDRAATSSSIVGFAHGPGSGTSTANAGGVVQLVTPSRIETTLMVPNNAMGMPTVLGLSFVPEPGLLLLLASGVGGLALLGRRRLRR